MCCLSQLVMERVREIIQDGFDFVLRSQLSHCLQAVQFQSNHGSGPPHQLAQPVDLVSLDATPPAHHSKEYAGHYKLLDGLQEPVAHAEWLEAPLAEWTCLSLSGEGISLVRPVQFIVAVEAKVLVGVHSLHFLPLDDGWGRGSPLPPIIHHHLLGLTDVELQVVTVVPVVCAVTDWEQKNGPGISTHQRPTRLLTHRKNTHFWCSSDGESKLQCTTTMYKKNE